MRSWPAKFATHKICHGCGEKDKPLLRCAKCGVVAYCDKVSSVSFLCLKGCYVIQKLLLMLMFHHYRNARKLDGKRKDIRRRAKSSQIEASVHW